MKARFIMRYAGHGALNHLTVLDDADHVIRHIVVDAGTNATHFPDVAEGEFEEVAGSICASATRNSVDICLTHADEDHYSYIYRLVEYIKEHAQDHIDAIDHLYLTLLADETGFANDPAREVDRIVPGLGALTNDFMRENREDRFRVLGEREVDTTLWQDPSRCATFKLAYTNLCSSRGDKNGNSSMFTLKLGSTVVLMPGDSTGETFRNLLDDQDVRDGVTSTVSDADKIILVLPHHGSVHSLEADGFLAGDDPDNHAINASRLHQAITLLVPNANAQLYVSADHHDTNGHPHEWTLDQFSTVATDSTEPMPIGFYRTNGGVYEELVNFHGVGEFVVGAQEKCLWSTVNVSNPEEPFAQFVYDEFED